MFAFPSESIFPSNTVISSDSKRLAGSSKVKPGYFLNSVLD